MGKNFEKLIKSYKPKPFWRFRRRVRDAVDFPRHKYYEVKYFIQRGRRGWSDADVWDLDGYLARVLGESIAHLAETTHGWPGGSEWPKFEDWQNELREVSQILIDYDKGRWNFSPNNINAGFESIEPAIKRLSKYWGHLWD
jgi:hypothetical protein